MMGDFWNTRILRQNKQILACEFQGQPARWWERKEDMIELPEIHIHLCQKNTQTPALQLEAKLEAIPGDSSP